MNTKSDLTVRKNTGFFGKSKGYTVGLSDAETGIIAGAVIVGTTYTVGKLLCKGAKVIGNIFKEEDY